MNSPPTVPPLLVDAREAARLLSISPRALWQLTNQGDMPVIRIGRAVRYDVAALGRWVAEATAKLQKRGRR
jgi:excisionase family DNA binding protein